MKKQNPDIESLYTLYQNSTGVSKDTRTLKPGNLYFALKGPNHNGNDYASTALEKGASYVVLDEEQTSLKGDERVIFVRNVLDTLQKLAHYHRNQLNAKIIGLTGSNGKTTTKELLCAILKAYEIGSYATEGNLNNHIGVPLTLLSIPSSAKFAIIEMGSSQPGDIEELCGIVVPAYGLIINIGKTHLEKLVDKEGVFREKSALFQSVASRDGIFFQNQSDAFLSTLPSERAISFSKTRTLYSHIKAIKNSAALSFDLERNNETVRIQTKLFGMYNLENIAAAITIAEYFSVPMGIIRQAIEEYKPSNMRSELRKTTKNIIILDAYNANPSSLERALKEFSEIGSSRKMAFIGDMLELGASSEMEHKKIANYVESLSRIQAYYIGTEFQRVAAPNQLIFKDVEECITFIKKQKISNFTILIKGSRGIYLEKLIPFL